MQVSQHSYYPVFIAALLCACAGSGTNNRAEGKADAGNSDGKPGALEDGGSPSQGGHDASTTGEPPATCDTLLCPLGQSCAVIGEQATCVADTCEKLACSATHVCEAAPKGDGFYCASNICNDDLECRPSYHCSADGSCIADLCEPDSERCEGDTVQRCAADGSQFEPGVTCGGAGSFESHCTLAGGEAYCSCQADWDCPLYTGCVAGRCEGTGKVASCTLPPSVFAEAIPSPEYGTRGDHWGGTSKSQVTAQAGTPFPNSTQVVMTPMVANLTDDNGDGEINELDFPEIVFLTFCATGTTVGGARYTRQGILRAIHGGGSQKGEDVFAACGKALTWQAGDATQGAAASCPCTPDEAASTPADLDPTAGVAVGDLDGNGTPEIVVVTQDDRLRLYDRLGRFLSETAPLGAGGDGNGSPSMANIDRSGLSEIVIGRVVATLKQQDDGKGNLTLAFDTLYLGNKAEGANGQGPISCVADVCSVAAGLEIVAGASVYHLPRAPDVSELGKVVRSPADCSAADVPNLVDDAREAELKAYCEAQLVLVWDGQDKNPGGPADREGFCAVADVWGSKQGTPGALDAPRPGPDNPLDGKPEVVLITDGQLQIYNGESGVLIFNQNAEPANDSGGAPNVDDFDGDGFPEIGTAFSAGYYMLDLQAPSGACPDWPSMWPTANLHESLVVARPAGNAERAPPAVTCTQDADCGAEFACNEAAGVCVCLHNGWKRMTQDDSSRVTGSSLFDFNGDGTVEVVYNDECFFRVYNGLDGEELSRDPSESRTRTENPVIADVDNDGNAEIVFGTSTESGFCGNTGGTFRSEADYRPGIEVWGDAADRWVSARRIYNQHSYHVTNVFEGGGIPVSEPPSWLPLNGRLYNSYRSQPRSSEGIAAPNLVIGRVQLSSPGAACGKLASNDLTIAVRVENRGDLRVGPGVKLGLYGEWSSPTLSAALKDAMGADLNLTLSGPLEPGAAVVLSVPYAASQNSRAALPESVRAVIDDGDAQRECEEDDNEQTVATADAGKPLSDLTAKLKSDTDCDGMSLEVQIENIGAVAASGVRYTLYLGDPSSGGQPLTSVTLPDPIAPGDSSTHTSVIAVSLDKDVNVFVVVDPMDAIPECNDANNRDSVEVKCAPPPLL